MQKAVTKITIQGMTLEVHEEGQGEAATPQGVPRGAQRVPLGGLAEALVAEMAKVQRGVLAGADNPKGTHATVVLHLDEADHEDLAKAIATREAFGGGGLVPPGGGNMTGRIVAEIARGWLEMLDAGKAKARTGSVPQTRLVPADQVARAIAADREAKAYFAGVDAARAGDGSGNGDGPKHEPVVKVPRAAPKKTRKRPARLPG